LSNLNTSERLNFMARWALIFTGFNSTVTYPGMKNQKADVLSRIHALNQFNSLQPILSLAAIVCPIQWDLEANFVEVTRTVPALAWGPEGQIYVPFTLRHVSGRHHAISLKGNSNCCPFLTNPGHTQEWTSSQTYLPLTTLPVSLWSWTNSRSTSKRVWESEGLPTWSKGQIPSASDPETPPPHSNSPEWFPATVTNHLVLA